MAVNLANIDRFFSTQAIEKGRYRITLSYPSIVSPPSLDVPKTVTMAGVKATLEQYVIDPSVNRIIIVVNFEPENSSLMAQGIVPVVGVGLVLAALLGLALIAFTVEKVEKIVDSPGVNVMLIALSAVVALFVWKEFKK